MLYKYKFFKQHKMYKLNLHLLYFIRKIKNIGSSARFIPSRYFHASFLNSDGKIAPNGRENVSLHDSFRNFFETFKKLEQTKKDEFYGLIVFSINIHDYFEDSTKNTSVLRSENIIRILGNNSFSSLMDTLWGSLKTNAWEIDKHYKDFYEELTHKTCPFCGLNKLPSPNSYRADYDHLAYKSDYPMSSINLKNIAPACEECNQRRKNSKDVFYAKDSVIRRKFNYPYKHFYNLEIDFARCILPNTEEEDLKGKWEIDFKPNNEFVQTWENIYEIKQRYVDEVLKIEYNKWYDHFVDEHKNTQVDNYEELKKRFLKNFKRFYKYKLDKGYIVKTSLYKFFYKCNNHVFYDQLIKELN